MLCISSEPWPCQQTARPGAASGGGGARACSHQELASRPAAFPERAAPRLRRPRSSPRPAAAAPGRSGPTRRAGVPLASGELTVGVSWCRHHVDIAGEGRGASQQGLARRAGGGGDGGGGRQWERLTACVAIGPLSKHCKARRTSVHRSLAAGSEGALPFPRAFWLINHCRKCGLDCDHRQRGGPQASRHPLALRRAHRQFAARRLRAMIPPHHKPGTRAPPEGGKTHKQRMLAGRQRRADFSGCCQARARPGAPSCLAQPMPPGPPPPRQTTTAAPAAHPARITRAVHEQASRTMQVRGVHRVRGDAEAVDSTPKPIF